MPPSGAPDPRVVILSSTFGGGHQRVAEVLADGLRQRHPRAGIEIYDFYADFINPTLNKALTSTYVALVRHAPRVWWAFYASTNEVETDSAFQRLINAFGMKRWVQYRNAASPDIAICTHPTPAGTISQANLAGRYTPCVTIITDYTAHSQWVHAGVDRYIVPSEEMAADLVRRGIPAGRVSATGVPVDPAFLQPVDRDAVIASHGFDPSLPLVLVMVGAQALVGGLPRAVARLVEAAPMNLLVVAGHSRTVVGQLNRIRHPRLRVLGFTPYVPQLMGAADLLITKPGGVTVSEATVRGVPMILFKPIPGQEDGNVAYMVEHGAAVIARKPAAVSRLAAELLADPERLRDMAARSRALARPNATGDTLDVVEAVMRQGAAVG